MKNSSRASRAFAPATVGNVAVGFDILGIALDNIGEIATVEKIERTRAVIVEPVAGYPDIPIEPTENTASAGLVQLIRDKKLNFGFRIRLEKKIPIGSGLGGSAASAVAAIVAANTLLEKKLTKMELLHYALIGEEVASHSRHGDNVAPCLFGGLVFVRSQPRLSVVPIPTPPDLRIVVLLPGLSINTKDARKVLSSTVPLTTMVEQTANLTGFLIGCMTGKTALIEESLRDAVIEPQRAKLIPSFFELQAAALQAGALGCSISGSGPAIFAIGESKIAEKIRSAFLTCAEAHGLKIEGVWISKIASQGAYSIGAKK